MPTLRTVLFAASVALLATVEVLAQNPELRGVWVARDGLTSRAKIISTLDQLAAANINLVCVNVWSRGYTIHPSDVLFAACGIRQDPDPAYVGRDPLQEFVIEAHRRGIEVEAWFEYGFMFGWSGWYAGANGQGPLLNAHPSWVGISNTGATQVSDGGTGFFTWASHEHPQVRQFLIDICVEVAARYDVDGIQFDRCRYPSTAWGYDPTTAAAYQAATGQAPPTNVNNTQWKRWRADRLNAFHQDLYAAVKARRGSLRVTDAPTVWPGSYDNFLQDWPQWVSGGSLDLVYPQVYRTTVSSYVTTLDQQLNALPAALRSKVAPGIRAISGTPTAEVLGMVAADRARNLPGHVFWYTEGLYDDLPALTTNYFQQPAAMPLRPAGWRPAPVELEENAPSVVASPWFVATPFPGGSAGAVRLAAVGAPPGQTIDYPLSVASAGLYSLLAHVPSTIGFATGAPFSLVHAGGTAVLALDQSPATKAGWRELGTFWLEPGPATASITTRPGQAVVADAVGLLRSRWPSGAFASLGSGTGGALGGVRLSMHGRAGLGGAIAVQANRLPAGMPVVIGIALQGTSLPLFGGTLYVLPLATAGGVGDALGVFTTSVAIPFVPSLVGTAVFAQALALDPAGVDGVSLSAGASALVQ
ncbi:MAG: family 10 glycosylhydrolase [Planctomycetes bacterium]|jgi:uncharacterized lipoprotein YddW (UPF0748 family)|nr:family 10 glycosylhydrolase [Planctomycetota bacterium]